MSKKDHAVNSTQHLLKSKEGDSKKVLFPLVLREREPPKKHGCFLGGAARKLLWLPLCLPLRHECTDVRAPRRFLLAGSAGGASYDGNAASVSF